MEILIDPYIEESDLAKITGVAASLINSGSLVSIVEGPDSIGGLFEEEGFKCMAIVPTAIDSMILVDKGFCTSCRARIDIPCAHMLAVACASQSVDPSSLI